MSVRRVSLGRRTLRRCGGGGLSTFNHGVGPLVTLVCFGDVMRGGQNHHKTSIFSRSSRLRRFRDILVGA